MTTTPQIADPRPDRTVMPTRFRKMPGGSIIDTRSGICMAHVAVQQMDTFTADRISNAIIAALDDLADEPSETASGRMVEAQMSRGYRSLGPARK